MRKTTAVLVLLIIILSCAFCSTLKENHDLRLKTNVSGLTPAFQFEFTSGAKYTGKGPIVTNVSAEQYDSSKEYNEYASIENAIDVADISRFSLDLIFTAKLANEAKCNGIYTLKIIAEGFDVTRKSIAGKLNPSTITILAADDLASRNGVNAGAIVDGESIKMNFTGNVCSTGALATFEVEYPYDSLIDPATYYTNITLEISSNN